MCPEIEMILSNLRDILTNQNLRSFEHNNENFKEVFTKKHYWSALKVNITGYQYGMNIYR